MVYFIGPLIMEGDSKNVIGWMDVLRAPWKLTKIIREIKELWGSSRQIASNKHNSSIKPKKKLKPFP